METVEQLVSFHHIQVQLSGGAPWGFTLQGGLEHGEPLLITKIEDGGKAMDSQKLKVGDELININGAVLYGSRQEALILIKGSYRVLKLTVRRRSVPLIRPHSWNLTQVSELPLPPPPPPLLPPCLPSDDFPPLPPPPPPAPPAPPSAMQLHPGSFSLPWTSSDHSDGSVQWSQLSRTFSTDRSSSLGSMDSLDTPTATTQPSPVDSALFNSNSNNNRDSAYSSFSASSNTSDYATVPLRAGETCSIENLLHLHSLGRAGETSALRSSSARGPDQEKSRSLTRPRTRSVDDRERPSSCCYEVERRAENFEVGRNGEDGGPEVRKSSPPQPPTRKDSFRATHSRHHVANNRCASAPIEVSESSPYCGDNVDYGIQNGLTEPEDGERSENFQEDTKEGGLFQKQIEDTSHIRSDGPSHRNSSPTGSSVEVQVRTKRSSASLHRHSAPEKLLATQLQLLQFNSSTSDTSDNFCPPSNSQWFQSSHQSPRENQENHHLHPLPNKWEGSRCSTAGSVTFKGDGGDSSERSEEFGPNGGSIQLVQQRWSHSVNVVDDPAESSAQGQMISERIREKDFHPLSSCGSVDSLLQEQKRGGLRKEENANEEAAVKKHNSHRRNRRSRSERFATNLRNEIQKKKAQLQRNHGPGGLLCSGETVHEEEDSELHEEQADPDVLVQDRGTKVASPSPVDDVPSEPFIETKLTPDTQTGSTARPVQILDPGVPCFGLGVRVVEEPAPAGKARRWRWTPEHKLQPEPERQSRALGEKVLGVTGSRHGVCTFSSSSSRSSSCSRMDQSDLLPFADRMKFFEETSRTGFSNLSSHRQKKPVNRAEICPHPAQRRYSYQEPSLLSNTVETRRQSVSTSRGCQEVREPDWERVELERERQERLWEQERQRDVEREKECLRRRDKAVERRRREEDEAWLRSHQEFHHSSENQGFQHLKDVQVQPQTFSHIQNQVQVQHQMFSRIQNQDQLQPQMFTHIQDQVQPQIFYPIQNQDQAQPQMFSRIQKQDQVQPQMFLNIQNQEQTSAFYPVYKTSQVLENQVYATTPPSFTPTEITWCPSRKLNRNYSLTERDYVSCKREFKPPENVTHRVDQNPGSSRYEDSRFSQAPSPAVAPPLAVAPLALRGRAMSENDLRLNSTSHWPPFVRTTQTLQEVEEVEAANTSLQNKKRTPPPRPPPPKWQEFHHRRASQHAIFSTGSSHSLDPPTDSSRPRSYSLPPERQEVVEACPRCCQSQSSAQLTMARPSPMFFRPVAPPQRVESLRNSYVGVEEKVDSPLPPPETSSFSEVCVDPSSGLQQTRSSAGLPPAVKPGGGSSCESYFCMDHQQMQHQNMESGTESETTLSPSPAHSLETDLDLNVPMETDIDDFQEEELQVEAEPISIELPCLALPVTVLETDMDTVPDSEVSVCSQTRMRKESGSAEEDLETEEGLDIHTFTQSSEGEVGPAIWRGNNHNEDHCSDSLDRFLGASSSCSSYYSTSAAKAQLISQMKVFTENREKIQDQDHELSYKKQLMESLRKKLGVLREAQRGLQDDIRANVLLGDQVEKMVVSVCKANEVDKFRMLIGDLDKVVSLQLSLSGRLLRVETTLETLDQTQEEQEMLPLLEKKQQLMRQLSEAQDLKDHVDRREQAVSRVLAQSLTPDQHRDYTHFVKMKAALLVEQRQLDDKIRLGEEQLRALRESLGLGLMLGYGSY